MKRIYISGGITGVPDYLQKFDDAEHELIDMGYESIINPAAVNSYLPTDLSHKDYMEISIAELRCCEAIYLLKGWEKSKGATVEKAFAVTKGMEIIYQ